MLPIRDHERSELFPIVTIVLIGLNIAGFLLEITSVDMEAFIRTWALVPSTLSFAQPESLLALLTSQFLHAGFAHIGLNMWFLWIFGDNVEGRFGHILFLLFYLAAGVVAALAQLWFIAGMDIPMLGASGAVAGALGAYWALFSHHRVDAVVPLGFAFTTTTLPAGMVLLFWFVGQLFSGTASVVDGSASVGGVAFFAHIGGFVFGWIIAQFFKRRPMQPSLMA